MRLTHVKAERIKIIKNAPRTLCSSAKLRFGLHAVTKALRATPRRSRKAKPLNQKTKYMRMFNILYQHKGIPDIGLFWFIFIFLFFSL